MRTTTVISGTTGTTGSGTTGTTGDRNLILVIFLSLVALLVCGIPVRLHAQVAMPDPRQVSGVPLPDASVPAGTVSVRVIRGSFANNLSNIDVTFTVDGTARSIRTDDAGRAQLAGLRRGATVSANAVVDGEKLQTQTITIGDTGVRFVLAAADPETTARAAEDERLAAGPAAKGTVVLGEDTQFVAELNNDGLFFQYTIGVVNTARTPVDIGGPLVFELPKGARGVAMGETSTKQASANGPRVVVLGPFAPGTTTVDFRFELPYSGPTAHVEQPMPAQLPSFIFAAFKTGAMDVSSAQLARKQVVEHEGRPVIIAMGPAIAAGQSFAIDITGLPHPPRWPRILALGLASFIVCAGIWGAVSLPGSKRAKRA